MALASCCFGGLNRDKGSSSSKRDRLVRRWRTQTNWNCKVGARTAVTFVGYEERLWKRLVGVTPVSFLGFIPGRLHAVHSPFLLENGGLKWRELGYLFGTTCLEEETRSPGAVFLANVLCLLLGSVSYDSGKDLQ